MSQLNAYGTRDSPSSPSVPERRFSKSKRLLLKALGSRKESKGQNENITKHLGPSLAKSTTGRRLSSRKHSSSSYYASAASNAYSRPDCSFQSRGPGDTTVHLDSSISYDGDAGDGGAAISILSSCSSRASQSSNSDALILCPQITITPEVSGVNGGSTNIWVAVEVAGLLRHSEIHHSQYNRSQRSASSPIDIQSPGSLKI
jgi:hypothetical protein